MIDINQMTVLIADDMPNMVTTIRGMMRVLKYGQKFVPANTGLEAWRLLKKEREEPIDLAIIDYNMPMMTGAELLTQIRSDRNFRDLPVVMVTGQANTEFVAEAAESEIDAYILKPPTMKLLGDKVLDVIQKANHPSPTVLHLKEARKREEAGDLDGAIMETHLAMEASPASSKPVRELGYYYLQKNDLKEAEKWLLKAVEMNSLDVYALHYLGKLYVRVNNIDAASKYFERAMAINPRDVTRAVYFGTTLLGKKRVKEATRVFDGALGLSEDNLKIKEQIVELCIEKNAKEYAVQLLESILRSHPDRKDLFLKLGVTLEALGQHSKALNYLTMAEKADRKNVDVKLHLGRVYLALGKTVRAEQSLREILEVDPKHEEATSLLQKCQ
jgi:tetratricopeptide (TPR) repeat protein